jgi:nitric oxide reductase NorD protein
MDLDEIIFTRFVNFFNNRAKRKEAANKEIVYLEEVKNRLTIIACALNGGVIKLLPAEKEGGYWDGMIFLPARVDLFKTFELNLSFYFFRVFYLSIQREFCSNLKIEEVILAETDSYKIAELFHKDVMEKLFIDYPLLENVYRLLDAEIQAKSDQEAKELQKWICGRWMFSEAKEGNSKGIEFDGFETENADNSLQNKTTIKAKPIESSEVITIDKKSQEDYVLTHNFEKVETADEFNGNWRSFDGEDELEDHENALDELNLRYMVRTQERSNSIYQTEFLDNTGIAESKQIEGAVSSVFLDEWDYKKRKYLPNYCQLFKYHLKEEMPTFYQRVLIEHKAMMMSMRKQLTNLRNKRIQLRQQAQGDEFDLDAVVDMFTDIHSNHTPRENIYLDKRKLENDVSILLLLDTSLSSDGYVNGKRILDIEKEVAVLFGEILNEFEIDFSIQCFNSRTRNHANYYSIKDFDESWGSTKFRIGSIQPDGYTRMGVALRHSYELLKVRNSKKKWLVLLSDGKPNDFDRYEGKYGVADVKQALHEQNEFGINSFALAVESNAKFYLPQMFGVNHFRILPSTDELLSTLIHLFEKIKFE